MTMEMTSTWCRTGQIPRSEDSSPSPRGRVIDWVQERIQVHARVKDKEQFIRGVMLPRQRHGLLLKTENEKKTMRKRYIDKDEDPKYLGNPVYISFLFSMNYSLKTLPIFFWWYRYTEWKHGYVAKNPAGHPHPLFHWFPMVSAVGNECRVRLKTLFSFQGMVIRFVRNGSRTLLLLCRFPRGLGVGLISTLQSMIIVWFNI